MNSGREGDQLKKLLEDTFQPSFARIQTIENIVKDIVSKLNNADNTRTSEHIETLTAIGTLSEKFDTMRKVTSGGRSKKPAGVNEASTMTGERFDNNALNWFKRKYKEDSDFRKRYDTDKIREYLDSNEKVINAKPAKKMDIIINAIHAYLQQNNLWDDVTREYEAEKAAYKNQVEQQIEADTDEEKPAPTKKSSSGKKPATGAKKAAAAPKTAKSKKKAPADESAEEPVNESADEPINESADDPQKDESMAEFETIDDSAGEPEPPKPAKMSAGKKPATGAKKVSPASRTKSAKAAPKKAAKK